MGLRLGADMRIALVSDLHGNAVALRAVLADIRSGGVDRIVCLGDIATLGPEPAAVIDMVRGMGCPCILGNHDAFLLQPDLIATYTQTGIVVDSVNWCREQLSPEDLAFLSGFADQLDITIEGSTLQCHHGSPRSHMDDILPTATDSELDWMLEGFTADLMAVGHTHIQMILQHRGTMIVNPGSVGLPFKEYARKQAPTLLDGADYATIESTNGILSVSLKNIPLDQSALVQAAEASDIPLRPWLLEQYA
jgi:putative phosphoesterase